MKENGRGFLVSPNNRTILGIKRLLKAEHVARNGIHDIAIGVWSVDGIPYDTYSLEEAQILYEKHREDSKRFKELNEKINSQNGKVRP